MSINNNIITNHTPVIYGDINKEQQVVVRDNKNEELFSAKVLTKEELDKSKEASSNYIAIKILTPKGDVDRYLKIEDIQNRINGSETALAFLQKVSSDQGTQGLRLSKVFELYSHSPKITRTETVFDQHHKPYERRISSYLTFQDCAKIVSTIEAKKKKWLKKVDSSETSLKKTISFKGKKFTVEIHPDNRKNKEKLGRIDVKLEFINEGTLKKVFKCFHYETNQINSGLYFNTKRGDLTRINNELAVSEKLINEIDTKNTNPHSSGIVISKAIDNFKLSETHKKHKLTQKYYPQELYNVIANKRLPDGTPLTEKHAHDFAIDILRGLEKLHEIGVIHRDIKPENIVIKYSPKHRRFIAKINDYDLSYIIANNETPKASGSRLYVSPEILKAANLQEPVPVDKRADLYSAGISLRATFDVKYGKWWKFFPDGGCELSLQTLLLYVQSKTHSEKEPARNTFEWGCWKLTHTDPEKRFPDAKTAREYFENLNTNP